jgi:hypothetical protein
MPRLAYGYPAIMYVDGLVTISAYLRISYWDMEQESYAQARAVGWGRIKMLSMSRPVRAIQDAVFIVPPSKSILCKGEVV